MGVARAVNFANRADVPLVVDTNMAKVMAFKARFMVARVVTGEWGVDRYAMDSSRGIDFVAKFSALEGQLGLRGDWRRGSGWERLGVGTRSQFIDVSFQIVGELGHLHLVKGGEQVLLYFALNGTKGIASAANTRQGGGEV